MRECYIPTVLMTELAETSYIGILESWQRGNGWLLGITNVYTGTDERWGERDVKIKLGGRRG